MRRIPLATQPDESLNDGIGDCVYRRGETGASCRKRRDVPLVLWFEPSPQNGNRFVARAANLEQSDREGIGIIATPSTGGFYPSP